MINSVVVDTSVVIKWVLYEPDSPTARSLLAEWVDQGIVVLAPALIAYEITNSLFQKIRKSEISHEKGFQAIANILNSDLNIDDPLDTSLCLRAIELANRLGLSATYDSHYLALAEREKCEFWTADTKMWRVVKDELPWVRWLGDYHPTSPQKE
jgi:predicted nucleic acid-binding protein